MVTYLTGCTACGTVNFVEKRKLGPDKATPIIHEWQSMGRFVAARCEVDPAARIESAPLLSEYRRWCEEMETKALPNQTIARALGTLFSVKRTRSNGKRYYVGITLKE